MYAAVGEVHKCQGVDDREERDEGRSEHASEIERDGCVGGA